jgi:hypothetical protein
MGDRAIERRGWLAIALFAIGCVNAPEPTTPAHVDETPVTTPLVSATFGGTLRSHDPAVANLPSDSRLALAQSPFRMLLLPAEYASGSRVMTDTHWAAVSYQGGGLSISIHATNVWHDGASDEELAALPRTTGAVHGHPAWETENEGIQSISWNEHDVAFALEVECADPEGDPRCADAALVRDLAGRLVPAHDEVTP